MKTQLSIQMHIFSFEDLTTGLTQLFDYFIFRVADLKPTVLTNLLA